MTNWPRDWLSVSNQRSINESVTKMLNENSCSCRWCDYMQNMRNCWRQIARCNCVTVSQTAANEQATRKIKQPSRNYFRFGIVVIFLVLLMNCMHSDSLHLFLALLSPSLARASPHSLAPSPSSRFFIQYSAVHTAAFPRSCIYFQVFIVTFASHFCELFFFLFALHVRFDFLQYSMLSDARFLSFCRIIMLALFSFIIFIGLFNFCCCRRSLGFLYFAVRLTCFSLARLNSRFAIGKDGQWAFRAV